MNLTKRKKCPTCEKSRMYYRKSQDDWRCSYCNNVPLVNSNPLNGWKRN